MIEFLTRLALKTLDDRECEVVRGDLAELGLTGAGALREVLSLAARRQMGRLATWSGALVASVAASVALLLAIASIRMADESAVYVWLYAENWDGSLISMPAFWSALATCLGRMVLLAATLAAASWAGGVLIGICGRRNTPVAAGALLGVLFCTAIFGVPGEFGRIFLLDRARDFQGNAPAFADGIYRTLFPRIFELGCVVLPLICGIQRNIRYGRLPLAVACCATAMAPLMQNVSYQGMNEWYLSLLLSRSLSAAILVAALGPATYLAIGAGDVSNRHTPQSMPGRRPGSAQL